LRQCSYAAINVPATAVIEQRGGLGLCLSYFHFISAHAFMNLVEAHTHMQSYHHVLVSSIAIAFRRGIYYRCRKFLAEFSLSCHLYDVSSLLTRRG
jgi:hypothetical protein